MSPHQTLHPDPSHVPVRDDGRDDWHPAALSDRELLDLHRRLVKVQSLGDAFADVHLSPQMARRLRDVTK